MQSVTSRACQKFLRKSAERNIKRVSEVPKEKGKVQNIPSRACQKLLGKSAERNIKSVSEVPRKKRRA